MRYLTLLLLILAGPAQAHHEVVMATSILPTLTGLALVFMAAFAGWRARMRPGLRRKEHKE